MLSTLPVTFVTIVERGSITLAADELRIAKSAVSQNLKRLEERIGVKLATRTTRSFTLTPAGKRYYSRCKEMAALAKEAVTEMENFGSTPAGPIIITAPHALITPVIAPAMAQVISRFPKLRPQIIADDKRLNLVSSGIDVSITVGDLPDSGLKARRIGTLRDVLCAAPSLLLGQPDGGGGDVLTWVQSLPYIAHTREASLVEHQLTSLTTNKPCILGFNSTFMSNTVEALAAFARDGVGLALLPEIAVRNDLSNGRLIRVMPEYEIQEKPIYAIHAYGTQPPKSVLSVIEAFEKELKECQ